MDNFIEKSTNSSKTNIINCKEFENEMCNSIEINKKHNNNTPTNNNNNNHFKHNRISNRNLDCKCNCKKTIYKNPYSSIVLLLMLVLIESSCVECITDPSTPAQLEAKVGSHVAFNCHIDFPYDFPIPYVVHWSKDNKKIFTWYEGEGSTNELFNGRLNMIVNHADFGKASVNLTSIRESDQGWYHCQIIFPNRSPSVRNNGTWYHLTVQGGSLIKIPPVNQTIMEGQTAFFHCVMKFPDVSAITWYKDGVKLKDTQELERRSFIGPDGSLSIDPTMMSDFGEYECNVENSDGEVQTAKAFLNIQYKAKVIYAPPEVFLPYGQPAVLDCHFRANPPLKNLRWEKDGLLYDSYNVPGVFYKRNGSLFFSKVNEHHAGSYTCTPYNDLGTDGPSPVISVIVLRPPIFTVTPKAIYIQKLGESAEFPCQAIDRDGNNRPNIIWGRKDGAPLPAGRFINDNGNITITQLSETDRGVYECSATNEAATITTETELMIENLAPRPPYNLTANSTETSITIRWKSGYTRPNVEYTIWYRLADMPEWRTMRILNKSVMEATVNNLQPGRQYEFMVLSQDKHGEGMFSKQTIFSTLPALEESPQEKGDDVEKKDEEEEQEEDRVSNQEHQSSIVTKPVAVASPLGPPRNLSAAVNSQGWLLHWEHPEHGAEKLRLYTVRWFKEPEHMLIGTAETLDNFYQLRHLRDEGTFIVQVHAVSIDGEQVASSEFLIEVQSHRKMRAFAIGSTVAILFLSSALCVFLYVKRSCLRHLVAGSTSDSCESVAENIKDGGKMNIS